MREIKFRVFFNFFDDEGYMDFPDFVGNDGKTIIYDGDECELDENLILMQYTGLRDKNFKEIYEGDIVRDMSDGIIGQIEYSDGGFIIIYDDIAEKLNKDKSAYLEVVGNVFENQG